MNIDKKSITCMSWMNVNNKNKRCTREKFKETDFCKYHKRSSIYMESLKPVKEQALVKQKLIIQPAKNIVNANKLVKSSDGEIDYMELDKISSETLLGIYTSWQEIPKIYWLQLNNRWWDIRILADLISNQLCTSEMETPKPTYPHDPFDRRNFTYTEILKIKQKCIDLKMRIYIGMRVLLNNISRVILSDEYGTSQETMMSIIKVLQTSLRYKLMNSKNSQECYTGIWVQQYEPKSYFEKMHIQYDSLPIQNIAFDMYYNEMVIIDNPARILAQKMLDNLKPEDVDINTPNLLSQIL
jgi:hypothetical protein